jgi:hypothetical protein
MKILQILALVAVLGLTGNLKGVVVFQTDATGDANFQSDSTGILANGPSTTRSLAQSFIISGSGDYTLDRVSLYMLSAPVPGGTFAVSIYDDSSSKPGTLLPGGGLSLQSGDNPASQGVSDYLPSGSLELTAGTVYWVVANVTGTGLYSWSYVNDNTKYEPQFGDTVGWSYTISGVWQTADETKPQVMEVAATVVPEPGEYALIFGLGLAGFAAYRRFAVKAA